MHLLHRLIPITAPDRNLRLLFVFLFGSCFAVSNFVAAAEHDEHGKSGHEEKPLQLSAETLKEFGVATAVAGSGKIRIEVQLPGEVRLNEDNLAHIAPRYAGVVKEVRKRLGDHVEKNEVMAVIENNESLVPYELRSLIAGTVIKKHVTLGEVLDLNSDSYLVADLSTVWVDLTIYQKDIGRIRAGQEVEIIAPHDLGSARGTISYISPSISEETRTGLARVILPNPSELWMPGMFITGHVLVAEEDVAIVIPLTALQTVENAPSVFVRTKEGFRPRAVQLGRRNAMHGEVVSGLSAGEIYAATGSFVLKAEMEKGSFGEGHGH